MVGRPLESIMILHDFYTVFAIVTGVDFIGVLAFINERQHPDMVKILKILFAAATLSTIMATTA
jgi:hypothetical protein